MFSLLLSSVVIAGGTYLLYQYLFGEEPGSDDYAVQEQEVEQPEDATDTGGFRLRIFFGSQSGTAEGFAFDLEKEAKQLGFSAKAIDLEDFEPDALAKEHLCVFLMATYGEGEPTDNAQEFFSWLSDADERESGELKKVEFAVFGLGNSQYEFFNAMGRECDSLLEKYGATRIFDRGEGDDDVGSIDDQFGEWKDGLLPLLCSKYLGLSDIGPSKFECSLTVRVLSEDEIATSYGVVKRLHHKLPYDLTLYETTTCNDKRPFLPSRHRPYSNRVGICRLASKRQLRQNTSEGSTLHIDFDLTYNENVNRKNPILQYSTADNMGFIPRNDPKAVAKICERIGMRPDDVVAISPKDPTQPANHTFPAVVSVRNLFLWYLDINAAPSKKLLSTLANDFTVDEDEMYSILAFLDKRKSARNSMIFVSPDSGEDIESKTDSSSYFLQTTTRTHITLLDILQSYPSIKVDLASLLELLKPLQPRLYTICSSSLVDPNTVSVCIKLETADRDTSNDDFLWRGVQSNYLSQCKVGGTLQYYFEDSKFRLPRHETPIIMIGPGAGLAPFAAFIDEGMAIVKSKGAQYSQQDFGEWWLFFGCRYREGDYIYREKLKEAYEDPEGVLTELRVAFSREQKEKVYVQDLIEKEGRKMWELVDGKKAKVFVCGGVAMGNAVRETFKKIFGKFGDGVDGAGYLDRMLGSEQYVQELWG